MDWGKWRELPDTAHSSDEKWLVVIKEGLANAGLDDAGIRLFGPKNKSAGEKVWVEHAEIPTKTLLSQSQEQAVYCHSI